MKKLDEEVTRRAARKPMAVAPTKYPITNNQSNQEIVLSFILVLGAHGADRYS